MTSNEKFQPGEETFEDVTPHVMRGRGLDAEAPTEDDTEGHARRSVSAEEEDTEGHMPRVRFALPEEPSEDDGGDDTEGHATRVRV